MKGNFTLETRNRETLPILQRKEKLVEKRISLRYPDYVKKVRGQRL